MLLKFQGVRFKRSQGRTLVSKRGEPERKFLILRPKFGIQDELSEISSNMNKYFVTHALSLRNGNIYFYSTVDLE